MNGMAEHAKPPAKRDHLWVLVIISGSAAIEVCASWVGIGALSGFPVIRLPFGFPAVNTDFSLMVGMEAYSGYSLYRWLACGDGPRARAFAMWSAIVALVLSLVGQVSYHILAASRSPRHSPYALVGFVAALPVLVVMLAAILIHLVHLDREDAAEAGRRAAQAERDAADARAAADGRAALRAQVADLDARLADAERARSETVRQLAQAAQETARLHRALAAQKDARKAARGAREPRAGEGADAPRKTRAAATENEVDARTKALRILSEQPDISGAQLGLAVGMSKRWGQDHRTALAELAAAFDSDEAASETAAGDPQQEA